MNSERWRNGIMHEEWKNDFDSVIYGLKMSYDDYNSIMGYIMEGYNQLKTQKPMCTVTSEVRYKDHLRHCPSCGKALPNSGEYGKSNYCYKCGLAVKWTPKPSIE